MLLVTNCSLLIVITCTYTTENIHIVHPERVFFTLSVLFFLRCPELKESAVLPVLAAKPKRSNFELV